MTIKTRIAAIAKDEGAYLTQWVFHHFYFGFDSIDIYINRTTDNSLAICDKLSTSYNLRVQDGDALVASHGTNLQTAAYEHAYQLARDEGVTHLIYLDIDEFWTPLDFTTKVNEHVQRHDSCDVLCYEWAFPSNDSSPFSIPFSESRTLQKNYHLKCLFDTHIAVDSISVHNVISHSARYAMADGSPALFDTTKKATISIDDTVGPLKEVFILHRVARSQLEYVSLLGRGRPSVPNKLKSNRWGYIDTADGVPFEIPKHRLDPYASGLSEVMRRSGVDHDIKDSKQFILDRFRSVVLALSSASIDDQDAHLAMLWNVTLQSVSEAMDAARTGRYVDLDSLIDSDLKSVLGTATRAAADLPP
jgi:hypothetical protein